MEKQVFTNEIILSWLQYYAGNTTIDLEHVKIIDITRKNKNVIPTVGVTQNDVNLYQCRNQ